MARDRRRDAVVFLAEDVPEPVEEVVRPRDQTRRPTCDSGTTARAASRTPSAVWSSIGTSSGGLDMAAEGSSPSNCPSRRTANGRRLQPRLIARPEQAPGGVLQGRGTLVSP